VGGHRRTDEPADSVTPFAAALRLNSGEIVASGTGVGVDDAERRRLLAQVREDAHQHRVLDHIGEVAGMKDVTIIHAREVMRANSDL